MSCDWDIKCVDCDEKHGFDDMNHEEATMLALIRHADVIAGLYLLIQDPNADVELVINNRRNADPTFFKKHQGHRLRPIDEYGRLSGDCVERVDCPTCGARHPCKLPNGHEEPHR